MFNRNTPKKLKYTKVMRTTPKIQISTSRQ